MTCRATWLLLVVLVAGCRCRPGPVEPIELGLRVQPAELEFGRVLEGANKVESITLTAATRAAISVQLGTDAPFSVAPTAEVPGGGDLVVPVTFRARDGEAEGILRLTVGDRSAELRLHGLGVRPPECVPSAECVVSVYSLEEDRCIESQAAEDAPCDPASVCLEQGRCRAGQCLGIARRCDDNDVCTDDACAMDIGCIHTPHACPRPAARCQVATCDARLGCGEGPAPDLSECGPVNCTEVNFCFSGACQTQPTPDGLPCSPAFACLPEAQCHNQVCTRVTEADWAPSWSARLEGEPAGALASSGSTLFFSLCVDGGTPDAGDPVDAGSDDAGEDGGFLDDGGLDAGAPWQPACGLTSYTGTGFERFERDGGRQARDYEDGAPRTVLAVTAQGVVLQRDGGLELRSAMTGALRDELPGALARALIVIERERVLFWADGGVQAWSDGGVQLLTSVAEPTAMGRGAALFTWNADAGVLIRLSFLGDGGLERAEISSTGIGSPALSVVSNDAILGPVGRVRMNGVDDAGLTLFDWSTLPADRFLDEQTLSSSAATDVFFQRCTAGCGAPDDQTWVAAFSASTGELLWNAPVVTPLFPGTLLTTTLIDGPAPGAVVAVVRGELDAGARTVASLFADGERKAVCRLPALGVVEQAHFTTSALVVTVRRPDGSVVLESYDLGGLPVSRSGWPTSQGVNGTRSDRP